MPFISVADEVSKKGTTSIENSFILKYLPELEPAAVKIYLFSLYIYQNGLTSYNAEDFAKKFGITESDLKNYFDYLEEFELVTVTSDNPLEIRILDCNNVNGTPKKVKPEKYADFSTQVQSVITGRMISTNEFMEYYYLLEEYGFEQNALIMIVNYCVNLKGNDIRLQYIKKVAKSFAADGATTARKVEEKLASYSSSTPSLIKIFSALSITRKPDIDDDKLYDKWTNELGFNDDTIICAAKHFKAKTCDKIDAALTELFNNKKFDSKEIADYCKNKTSVYNATLQIAKSLGIYIQNPSPYVENYTSVWINYGFEPDTLKIIAEYCFLQGKKTFEGMHDFIVLLYDEGVITEQNVTDKLNGIAAENKLMKNILTKCGLTRRVIDSDRDCLNRWKSWGFPEEMLLSAAALASGKSNPVSYMNAILSSWKNDGIMTADKITEKGSPDGGESKKAIIERHFYDLRAQAKQRAEKAQNKAMSDSVYADIKRQINSLSIQVAFTEINDEQAAKKISEKIVSLEQQADERLQALGIARAQLVPQYKCKLCNDTGYNSDGKQCECLKKFISDNKL